MALHLWQQGRPGVQGEEVVQEEVGLKCVLARSHVDLALALEVYLGVAVPSRDWQ
jgi:hypothetical protein